MYGTLNRVYRVGCFFKMKFLVRFKVLLGRQCKAEIDNFFYYHLIAIHLSSDGSAAVLLSHLKFFLGLCCCCFSNVELRTLGTEFTDGHSMLMESIPKTRARPDWAYEFPDRTGPDTQICQTGPAGLD